MKDYITITKILPTVPGGEVAIQHYEELDDAQSNGYDLLDTKITSKLAQNGIAYLYITFILTK